MIRTNNKVALYARFSSDNQRSESIDAQIRAMTTYCKQHKFTIVDTYIDEAKSATTDRRPAFQQMISDSSNHNFDILLVHKLDRFARNRYDSAVYKRELKKNGVLVYSVLENLDDSPESIMMEAVLEGMSEYYSQNLAREVMKGMRETALQTKHTGGKPPLGYDVDVNTKQLKINPVEAESVKLIFEMYAEGYGYSPILERLHNENRLTKNGKEFQKNSLYSILSNPKYTGMYVFNRSSSKNAEGTRNTHLYKDNEEIIFIEDGCPKIVEKDVYEKVQRRISENKHIGGRHNAKQYYLLSGKVYCKECGRAMVGNMRYSGRDKLQYVTYRCPSKSYNCSNKEINRDYLEHYIIFLLEKQIFNTTSLNRIAKKINRYSSTDNDEMERLDLQKQLSEVEIALKNVADAIAAGLLSDALVTRLKELEANKAEIKVKIESLNRTHDEITVEPSVILGQYHEVKKSPSSPAYKEFIGSFIGKIEVGKYNVDITLKTGLDLFPALDSTYNVRRQEIYERQ